MLAVTLFRPPPTAGPYGRDFEAYYAAGAVWNDGGDPWSREVWRVERTIPAVDTSRDELLPYVGPAAALPLFGALARLPWPVAVRLWSGLLAAALGALVVASLGLSRRRSVLVLLGTIVFALSSGPMTSDLALGQVALLSAAGIACALVAYERRAVPAGALATLLAGLQPNIALGLIARMRDRTAWMSAVIAGIAFAAITLAAGGGGGGLVAYVHRLGEHGAAERFVTIQHTPAAIAWAVGASPGAAGALGFALALAALVALVLVTIRARLKARDGTLFAFALLPFVVPFFHEHDFVLEVIPLIVLAATASGRARALAGVAAALILVDWFGLAQRGPATEQIIAQGIAIACGFAAIGPGARARRADLAAFAAVAAAACIAIPLARAAPAPTWPDGLPPGYRAPATPDASVVWGDEQRAAGLVTRRPAWGALRVLPLAGCMMLGGAIVLAGRRKAA